MKKILISAAIALCFAPGAFAQDHMSAPGQGPICVRASDRSDYNARAIGRHDVYIENSLGKDHRALRLSTTCIDLDPISITGVSVHSFSTCVAMGDQVSAVSIDGHVDHCRVSHVSPFVPGTEEKGYK